MLPIDYKGIAILVWITAIYTRHVLFTGDDVCITWLRHRLVWCGMSVTLILTIKNIQTFKLVKLLKIKSWAQKWVSGYLFSGPPGGNVTLINLLAKKRPHEIKSLKLWKWKCHHRSSVHWAQVHANIRSYLGRCCVTVGWFNCRYILRWIVYQLPKTNGIVVFAFRMYDS